MSLTDDLQRYLAERGGELTEKKGAWEYAVTVAERKAFLSRRKLAYRAAFRVDDEHRVVHFTERLVESGAGLSTGDDAAGFGFQAGSYKTSGRGREGTLEEQSSLFGQRYDYTFDFAAVRKDVASLAEKAGYEFSYRIAGKV
jgi:hypothetical protein